MYNTKCVHGCITNRAAGVLLIIGGLNWGLVGLGMLLDSNLNVVNIVLDSAPVLESILYILIGLAAIMKIFGCRCAKCKVFCSSCASDASPEKTEGKM